MTRADGRRYPALRLFAGLNTLLGSLLVVAGVVLLLASLAMGAAAAGSMRMNYALVYLIWAGMMILGGVQCLALGQLFRLAIDVESNTRATAMLLERLGSKPGPDDPWFRS